MNKIEFNTNITDGIIHLPMPYNSYKGKSVRVVLFIEPDDIQPQKKELSRIFAGLQALNAFSEIDDPVGWQKQQRDEWE